MRQQQTHLHHQRHHSNKEDAIATSSRSQPKPNPSSIASILLGRLSHKFSCSVTQNKAARTMPTSKYQKTLKARMHYNTLLALLSVSEMPENKKKELHTRMLHVYNELIQGDDILTEEQGRSNERPESPKFVQPCQRLQEQNNQYLPSPFQSSSQTPDCVCLLTSASSRIFPNGEDFGSLFFSGPLGVCLRFLRSPSSSLLLSS